MSLEFRGLEASDLSQCDNARSFLQSGFWGSFKAIFGWKAGAFKLGWSDGTSTSLLVLRRRLGPFINFAYLPWGPEMPDEISSCTVNRAKTLEVIAKALKAYFPTDLAFIRYDLPWELNDAERYQLLPRPFRRAGADIQAPDTVIINLDKPSSELLAAMKPKWRYNVRLAERKGVNIRQADASGIDIFYSLLKETAHRDRIAIHEKNYYAQLFEQAAACPAETLAVRLYIAEREGPLAALVALFRGEEATYLYGASSNRDRNLMANYALQWRVMLDAQAFGCLRYDLFGIPPSVNKHPMSGLYRFKTGFGGKIIHRPGCWDYDYKPLASALFRAAERLRQSLRRIKAASHSKARLTTGSPPTLSSD